MSIRTTHRTAPCALALAAALAACSSTKDYTAEYSERLGEAHSGIERGDLSAAHATTVALIGDLEGRGVDDYRAQRALADALMVELHASADEGSAFLKEPGERRSSIYGGNDGEDGVPSTTAHRLAAVFHAWHLLQRSESLNSVQDGTGIAPAGLQHFFERRHSANYAWLVAAASLSELGFEGEAASVLEQIDHPTLGRAFGVSNDPSAHETMIRILEEHDLPPNVQWHLLATAHRIQRDRFESTDRSSDPTLAYRLGCLTALGRLEAVPGTNFQAHSGDVVDQEWTDEFHRWVRSLEDKGGFYSSARTPFRDGVTVCTSSGEPAVDFTWESNG